MSDIFMFSADASVKQLGVKGVYFTMTGLQNKVTDERFENYKNDCLNHLSDQLQSSVLDTSPVLAGFRTLHTKINRSNKKYVASPENLLQIFLKHRSLPKINLLVDIYNLISLKYFLALGAHDIVAVNSNITLKLADGTETFHPLGYTDSRPVQAGDYIYADDSHNVLCYMEVKQCEKSKVTLETTDSFYIVQGHAQTDNDYLKTAADELIALTQDFCGGKAEILCCF